MLQLRDPACILPVLWSLSCKWQLDSSSIAICCFTQVPLWSPTVHWVNPHSPLALCHTHPWPLLTQAFYKNYQCFLTLLSYLTYSQHCFIVYFLEISGILFLLFEYGHFSCSASFSRVKLMLASCLNFDMVPSFTMLSHYLFYPIKY